MTSADLLWAARQIAARTKLVGAEVVEVIPTAVGSADITALAAERIVREIVTGIAVARKRPAPRFVSGWSPRRRGAPGRGR